MIWRAAGLLTVLSLILSSCAEMDSLSIDTLIVRPAGSLQRGVVFMFADKYGHHPPPLFDIESLDVQKYGPGGGSGRIWLLEGSSLRHFVVYGAKYRGLKTSWPAEKLVRDQKYEVSIFSKTGHDSADFRIDQNGVVVPLVR